MIDVDHSADWAWVLLLRRIREHGRASAPRGMATRELPQETVVVDMRRPVVTCPDRALSYRFAAAESWWILSGRDDLGALLPYNKRMAEFSDDGVKLSGAYGPPIARQIPYVVTTLERDRDSRQAGLTIWCERPKQSKDIPCTVAIFFRVHGRLLDAHVFMRSSDVWLGLPYDVFAFSMLSHLVAGILTREAFGPGDGVAPGSLHLTAASSHLYDRDAEGAAACAAWTPPSHQPETPPALYTSPEALMATLAALKDSKRGDPRRWWEITP